MGRNVNGTNSKGTNSKGTKCKWDELWGTNSKGRNVMYRSEWSPIKFSKKINLYILFRKMMPLIIKLMELKKNDHFYENVKVLLIIKHHQNGVKHVQKQMTLIIIIIIIQKMR